MKLNRTVFTKMLSAYLAPIYPAKFTFDLVISTLITAMRNVFTARAAKLLI